MSKHEPNLGQLITEETPFRDAIHIAVAPVKAMENLMPGMHVGFPPDGKGTELVETTENPIGIVDPFLKGEVKAGERFWLFLYPKSITSLRHDWTHPAFPLNTSVTYDDKKFSEMWLRTYAERLNCYDDREEAFDRLIEGLRSRSIYTHGTTLQGLDSLDAADDLRKHAENYLGITINWADYTFRCSC